MTPRVFASILTFVYALCIVWGVHPESVGHWIASGIGTVAAFFVALNFAYMLLTYQSFRKHS